MWKWCGIDKRRAVRDYKTSMNPQTNILAAVWDSAYVNALPDASFAFVDGKTRKLPYKDSSGKVDLPHVRNALARLNQTQGIPDSEKATIKTKLQSALKNAKASDDTIMRAWQAVQASNDDVLPSRVMLLRSGDFNTEKYGTIPLSASDLQEMKDNFDNGVGMAGDGETGIPIDFAHQSHLKAAGWVKGLEIQADDSGSALFGTNLEWSDSGKQALLGKEYKCLSSDFYPKAFGEWADAESGVTAQNVIVGAALTNRPMFTGNQTVLASEATEDEGGVHTVININADQENKEKSMNIEALRVKAADEVTGPEQRFLQANYAQLSADERTKFELVSPTEKETPKVIKASEVTGTEGNVTVQAADLKAQNDKIKELDTTVGTLKTSVEASEKEKVAQFVDKQIDRGAIIADQKDKWVGQILADATNKELLEKLPSSKVLGGKQGGNASESSDKSGKEQLTAKAQELVAADTTGKLGIQAAYTQVSTDPKNKELVERAAEENRALAGVTGAVA